MKLFGFGSVFPEKADLELMMQHERHEAWLLAREADIEIEGGLAVVQPRKGDFPFDIDAHPELRMDERERV